MEVDATMKKYRLLGLFLALAMLLIILPTFTATAQTDVQALFINIGKGDAALFFLGDSRYLVDTGRKEHFDQLARVLDVYGVTHLDGIIITHTDKDHVGGLKKLLKSGMQADCLYAGALHSEKSTEDHPVYEAAEKYEIPLVWLNAGDAVEAGDGCAFQVLGPLSLDPDKENNNSLVLRLTTPEGDMLLTGDMELPEEAELIGAGLIAQAPVLKVPHHGEDDATGQQLALLARPDWAIISTNTEEEPDTPDDEVLTRLWKAGANIAVTQNAQVGIMVIMQDGGVADVQQINWQ